MINLINHFGMIAQAIFSTWSWRPAPPSPLALPPHGSTLTDPKGKFRRTGRGYFFRTAKWKIPHLAGG